MIVILIQATKLLRFFRTAELSEIACLAATSAAGIVEREPEAQSIEKASRDSLYRSDSCRAVSGVDANRMGLFVPLAGSFLLGLQKEQKELLTLSRLPSRK